MATKGPKRDLHTILVAASIKRKGEWPKNLAIHFVKNIVAQLQNSNSKFGVMPISYTLSNCRQK